VNGETANYASDLLGKTTIHTETSVDYQGTDKDNTRYSEAGRALMLPDEIRQMPKFRQLLVVTDTAPPVKAAFPPVYLRKDIQKAVIYRKPEVLRFSAAKTFSENFARNVSANGSADIGAKPKKSAKSKRTKNQTATNSAESGIGLQNDSHTVAHSETKLDAAVSEVTDSVLGEIGEHITNYETNGAISDGSRLALTCDERFDKPTEDFMQQKLKTILMGESSETSVLNENDSSGEQVIDRFDSDVVLRAESFQTSVEGVETNRKITLSANIELTDEEVARERKFAAKNFEPENEFYTALAQRVL
jgi:hypothetical protein